MPAVYFSVQRRNTCASHSLPCRCSFVRLLDRVDLAVLLHEHVLWHVSEPGRGVKRRAIGYIPDQPGPSLGDKTCQPPFASFPGSGLGLSSSSESTSSKPSNSLSPSDESSSFFLNWSPQWPSSSNPSSYLSSSRSIRASCCFTTSAACTCASSSCCFCLHSATTCWED
jgi:hypothetical protein